MTRTQMLLTILMEECAETSQRASKGIRFTLEEIQPKQKEQLTNAQRLIQEFNDIVAMMEMLQEDGAIDKVIDRTAIAKKKAQVEKWMKHSVKMGTVERDVKPVKINKHYVHKHDGDMLDLMEKAEAEMNERYKKPFILDWNVGVKKIKSK